MFLVLIMGGINCFGVFFVAIVEKILVDIMEGCVKFVADLGLDSEREGAAMAKVADNVFIYESLEERVKSENVSLKLYGSDKYYSVRSSAEKGLENELEGWRHDGRPENQKVNQKVNQNVNLDYAAYYLLSQRLLPATEGDEDAQQQIFRPPKSYPWHIYFYIFNCLWTKVPLAIMKVRRLYCDRQRAENKTPSIEEVILLSVAVVLSVVCYMKYKKFDKYKREIAGCCLCINIHINIHINKLLFALDQCAGEFNLDGLFLNDFQYKNLQQLSASRFIDLDADFMSALGASFCGRADARLYDRNYKARKCCASSDHTCMDILDLMDMWLGCMWMVYSIYNYYNFDSLNVELNVEVNIKLNVELIVVVFASVLAYSLLHFVFPKHDMGRASLSGLYLFQAHLEALEVLQARLQGSGFNLGHEYSPAYSPAHTPAPAPSQTGDLYDCFDDAARNCDCCDEAYCNCMDPDKGPDEGPDKGGGGYYYGRNRQNSNEDNSQNKRKYNKSNAWENDGENDSCNNKENGRDYHTQDYHAQYYDGTSIKVPPKSNGLLAWSMLSDPGLGYGVMDKLASYKGYNDVSGAGSDGDSDNYYDHDHDHGYRELRA